VPRSGKPREEIREVTMYDNVRRRRWHPVVLLLLLPLVGTLVPAFYNQIHPSIGGMPFFYWYQLAWIPVSVLCTWAVYRATRRQR
jgi:Protein of unknown function (DUF3311)